MLLVIVLLYYYSTILLIFPYITKVYIYKSYKRYPLEIAFKRLSKIGAKVEQKGRLGIKKVEYLIL